MTDAPKVESPMEFVVKIANELGQYNDAFPIAERSVIARDAALVQQAQAEAYNIVLEKAYEFIPMDRMEEATKILGQFSSAYRERIEDRAQAEAFERVKTLVREIDYTGGGLGWSAKAERAICDTLVDLFTKKIENLSPDPHYRDRIEAQAKLDMVEKCRTAVNATFSPMGPNSQGLWNMFNDWKKQLEAELARLTAPKEEK